MSRSRPQLRTKSEKIDITSSSKRPTSESTHKRSSDKSILETYIPYNPYKQNMSAVTKVDVLPEAFEEAVTEIKSYKPLMLGLDTKTQLNDSSQGELISVITIYVPNTMTYVFEVNKIWTTYKVLPPGLIRLLQSPHIIKVMFDPTTRANRLLRYDIRLDGVMDVRAAAKLRGFHKTGVDSLARELFKESYTHSEHWRKRKFFMNSKWAEELTDDMANYTASRAGLAVMIFGALSQLPVIAFDRPVKTED